LARGRKRRGKHLTLGRGKVRTHVAHLADRLGRTADAVAPGEAGLAHRPKQRKLLNVARHRARRLAAKAGHSLGHIHREADPRLLAIAHHVDAGLDLSVDHPGDSGHRLAMQLHVIDRLAGLLPQKKVRQLRRPGEAAAMRREDSLAAQQHGSRIVRTAGCFIWRPRC
jgi:hypothetical protein